jgi:hypothetical protein
MYSWQSILVAGAAFLFTGFLVWKYRPSAPLSTSTRSPRGVTQPSTESSESIAQRIKVAREAARAARTPRERAEALMAAAEAASLKRDGLTSAMGFYLRAMRADKTSSAAIEGLTALLRDERPELLETVLWRRLSHLSWSGDTTVAVRSAAEGLVALYRRELRSRDRARALQKLITRL